MMEKIEVFTPKGKVLLDLDKSEDITTFGGQEAVDDYLYERLIHKQIQDTMRMDAITELKAKGLLPKLVI